MAALKQACREEAQRAAESVGDGLPEEGWLDVAAAEGDLAAVPAVARVRDEFQARLAAFLAAGAWGTRRSGGCPSASSTARTCPAWPG
ncbi:MAG: hypothetical protein R3F60_17370 [bacterium]